MISIKRTGDQLAHEFNRLMGHNEELKKLASDVTAESALVDDGSTQSEKEPEDEGSSVWDANAADFLVSNVDEPDQVQNSLDSQIANFASSDRDPAGTYIMHGLGKIAASLRSKGEGFAADMVEATAFSVRDDFVKEASRKRELFSSLDKMASRFVSSGDSFAADMVKATINNIKNC